MLAHPLLPPQHQQYLQKVNNDRDPCTTFLEDFEAKLKTWLTLGNHIFVGSDLNQNVLDQEVWDVFEQHGLLNVLDTKHNLSHAPATFMYGQELMMAYGPLPMYWSYIVDILLQGIALHVITPCHGWMFSLRLSWSTYLIFPLPSKPDDYTFTTQRQKKSTSILIKSSYTSTMSFLVKPPSTNLSPMVPAWHQLKLWRPTGLMPYTLRPCS